ncbi:MAG: spore cortex-lytic enzyme [Eubacteriaceae bacterium]
MMKEASQKQTIKFIAVVFLIIFLMSVYENVLAKEKVIYYGSDYDAVGKVQRKLKDWGYYKGGVDGYFGYRTEQAVKSFQKKNGLSVDGICGPVTLDAMGLGNLIEREWDKKDTSSKSAGSNRNEAYLLAQAVHGEARGETYTGQVAVASVILNRVNNSSFPNSISGVIYQPGAFDAVSDGQIYLQPANTAIKAANDALAGWDPSGGAIYYYNPATSTNKWILSRPIITRIGKHVFCK